MNRPILSPNLSESNRPSDLFLNTSENIHQKDSMTSLPSPVSESSPKSQDGLYLSSSKPQSDMSRKPIGLYARSHRMASENPQLGWTSCILKSGTVTLKGGLLSTKKRQVVLCWPRSIPDVQIIFETCFLRDTSRLLDTKSIPFLGQISLAAINGT